MHYNPAISSHVIGAVKVHLGKTYQLMIIVNPAIRSGKPIIRSLRYVVCDILSCLAARMSVAEMLADFPVLTMEDIKACLVFAADRERIITVFLFDHHLSRKLVDNLAKSSHAAFHGLDRTEDITVGTFARYGNYIFAVIIQYHLPKT
nr:DUF433 domain-containing protein [uncultured Chloroflexus sp.]